MKRQCLALVLLLVSSKLCTANTVCDKCDLCENQACSRCTQGFGLKNASDPICHPCQTQNCLTCHTNMSVCETCKKDYAKNVISPGSVTCLNLEPMYSLLKLILLILLLGTVFLCGSFIIFNLVKSMRKKKEMYSQEVPVPMQAVSSKDTKKHKQNLDEDSIEE